MAQLHLYSSDHIILMDSPGRAPGVGYVLKFKNIASDPVFAAPINTRIGRRAPGIVLRAQVSSARPRRPPRRPSTLLSKQCHEPRGPGPRLRSPGFFVKKPAPGLLGEQPTLQLFTARASLKTAGARTGSAQPQTAFLASLFLEMERAASRSPKRLVLFFSFRLSGAGWTRRGVRASGV